MTSTGSTNDDKNTEGALGSPEKNNSTIVAPTNAGDCNGPSAVGNDDQECSEIVSNENPEAGDEATTPTATSPHKAAEPTLEGSSESEEKSKQPPVIAVSPDSHSDGENNNNSNRQDETDDKKGTKQKSPGSSSLPQRPIKRARTAYFIFLDAKRAEVQAKHPDEGVTGQARLLGDLWKSLSVEEKEVYQQQAAEERERVSREMEEWIAAGGSLESVGDPSNTSSGQKDPTSLVFPSTRIKKICRLDPEVKTISKEALLLITKCAELATAKLGKETVRVAQVQNRRKLLPEDVAQVCGTREQFLFLREDLKDLVRQQKQLQNEVAAATAATSGKAKSKVPDAAVAGSKPLTSYFSTSAN